MTSAIMKIAIGLVWKLLTEKMVGRAIVIGLRALANSTSNKVDDQMADAIDEALGYPNGKKES